MQSVRVLRETLARGDFATPWPTPRRPPACRRKRTRVFQHYLDAMTAHAQAAADAGGHAPDRLGRAQHAEPRRPADLGRAGRAHRADHGRDRPADPTGWNAPGTYAGSPTRHRRRVLVEPMPKLDVDSIVGPARQRLGEVFQGYRPDELVSADVAIRGFFGAVMSMQRRRGAGDGSWSRARLPQGRRRRRLPPLRDSRAAARTAPSSSCTSPDRPQGSWTFRRRHRPPHRLQRRHRRRARRAEGLVRGAGLHRHVGSEGPLLLPLDVRPVTGRRPGRVHGQRAGRLLRGRDAARSWART